MSTKTEFFDLTLYEGSDIFNPLEVENGNARVTDAALQKIKTEAVPTATELVSGSVHAITRTFPDAALFRFVATGKWNAGDTCTVDGTQVSTLTVSGESLPDGTWQINSNVLCCLVGTVLTVFAGGGASGGTIDADTLQGHSADYFATQEQLALKANKSVASSVQLTVAGWLVSGEGYTQTVTAAQVGPNTNIVVSPATSSFDTAVTAQIRATGQGANSITFYATAVPEQSVYMNVLIVG